LWHQPKHDESQHSQPPPVLTITGTSPGGLGATLQTGEPLPLVEQPLLEQTIPPFGLGKQL
jgi:hypothetical protein